MFTRAVLAWPDGRWVALTLDGGSALSSAVHVSRTEICIGATAWRRAAEDPDGFVVSPLHAGMDEIIVGGRVVGVAELVAATLREVNGEASRVAGGPVEDVVLVVPAGWGPARRTWLRRAAREAGIPAVQLLEAPIAAAGLLTGDHAAAGPVLVIDVGGGCEATVLQRGPSGFEVLSTLSDRDAGGDRIDAQLIAALTGSSLGDLPAHERWSVLANVRATKQALSEQVAITMPMPAGRPPTVVNASQVRKAATAVLDHAGQVAGDAVSNADLTFEQMGTVCLIGGATATPGAAEVIGAKLGIAVQTPHQPEIVAAYAAAGGGSTALRQPAARAPVARRPPWRRLVTLALPGLFSLLLYAHFVFGADFEGDRLTRAPGHFYVWASWGELAMAGVLAVIFWMQAASLFAAVLPDAPSESGTADADRRIVSQLGLAAVAGTATASMYAVSAAVYFSYPTAELLRWALLPSLPVAAGAAALAGAAWRGHRPGRGWDTLLAFPLSSSITAAAGAVGVALYNVAELEDSRIELADYLGAVLLGIAVACVLTRHLIARVVLAVPFCFFMLILSRAGLGIPATIYAIAVALWCGRHVWTLARTPPELSGPLG